MNQRTKQRKEKPPLFFGFSLTLHNLRLDVCMCIWEATLRNTRTTLKNLISTRDFQSAFDICTLYFNGYLTGPNFQFQEEDCRFFVNSLKLLYIVGYTTKRIHYTSSSAAQRITHSRTTDCPVIESIPIADDIVLSQQYFSS